MAYQPTPMNTGIWQYTNPYYPTQPPMTNPVPYNPQMNQQPTNGIIHGRTVNNVNEIAIGEVPQDGSLGLFPQADGSCIYAKSWDNNGNIRTMKFVPAEQPPSFEEKEETRTTQVMNNTIDPNQLTDMMNKLDNIIDILTTPSQINQNGSKSDKED